MKECPKCGNENEDEDKYCTTCSSPLDQSKSSLSRPSADTTSSEKKTVQPGVKKDPLHVALASLIPGLGHIFLGQVTKGVILLLANIVLSCYMGTIVYVMIALFAAVDGYKLAEKLNSGKELEDMEFFFQKKE